MLVAPFPENENLRLETLQHLQCAYSPREERFDRITRTAKRLLHVPISLISIVEAHELWYRSVQGLKVAHTPRDISFCAHAVALNQPFCISDTWYDPDFSDNPLVTGPPGIRSYLGWPLELAPGVAVGTLCVIDTMPRTFGPEDFDALKDLASMAEAELKITAMSNLQNRMLMRLNTLQRKGALDPLTGCWNIRGFRHLLDMSFDDARRGNSELALCQIHVNNFHQLLAKAQDTTLDTVTQLLAQVLLQRLPPPGALARLGQRSYCALVPCESKLALELQLAQLTFPRASINLPDNQRRLDITLSSHVVFLSELGPSATADSLWGQVLAFSGEGLQ